MAECKMAPMSKVAVSASAAKPTKRPSQALDWVLGRLYRALQRAPRELRHKNLQRLTPRVQAALLVFMESMNSKGASGAPKRRAPTPRRTPQAAGSIISLGRLYRAQGYLLNMRIITAAVPERQLAKSFQRVLQLTREALVVREASQVDEAMIVEAFASACLEEGTDLQAMGLAFRAEVSGRPYLKRDVWGRYSQDVSQALLDRNKLLRAKAEGWDAFRTAWISVLQAPCFVRSSAPRGWARHPHHSADEAEAIVDTAARQVARDTSGTKRGSKKQRLLRDEGAMDARICRAARLVERKLAAQERQVRKTVKAARAARAGRR